jgi:hypothetical protein
LNIEHEDVHCVARLGVKSYRRKIEEGEMKTGTAIFITVLAGGLILVASFPLVGQQLDSPAYQQYQELLTSLNVLPKAP